MPEIQWRHRQGEHMRRTTDTLTIAEQMSALANQADRDTYERTGRLVTDGLNVDTAIALTQSWMQRVFEKDTWIPEEERHHAEERIGYEFLEKIFASHDYTELIGYCFIANQMAKSDDRLESLFYRIKDLILAKMVMCAMIEAPPDSWGAKKDRGGMYVLYFDVPGLGQYSFHMPRFSFEGKILGGGIIPPYKGDWKSEYNRESFTPMTLERAHELAKTPASPLSLRDLQQILEEKPYSNTELHDFYVRAMGHPQFKTEKGEIQSLLFSRAITLPNALPEAFLAGIWNPEPPSSPNETIDTPAIIELTIEELEVELDELLQEQASQNDLASFKEKAKQMIAEQIAPLAKGLAKKDAQLLNGQYQSLEKAHLFLLSIGETTESVFPPVLFEAFTKKSSVNTMQNLLSRLYEIYFRVTKRAQTRARAKQEIQALLQEKEAFITDIQHPSSTKTRLQEAFTFVSTQIDSPDSSDQQVS